MAYDAADEFRVLRRRLDDLEQEARRVAEDGLGSRPRALVGRVFDGGAMPATVPAFYKVRPVALDGAEAVGEVVSAVASDWDEAVVLVLGPEVPDVDDVLVARLIGGYWVAQRGTAASETEVTCPTDYCGGLSRDPVTLTDANGTLTLVYEGGTSNKWSACYTIAGASDTRPIGCGASGVGPLSYKWELFCNNTNNVLELKETTPVEVCTGFNSRLRGDYCPGGVWTPIGGTIPSATLITDTPTLLTYSMGVGINPVLAVSGTVTVERPQDDPGWLPPTVYVTDSNGTHALHRTLNVTRHAGCYTVSSSNAYDGSTCTPTTGTIAIGYVLACSTVTPGGGASPFQRLTLTMSYKYNACGPGTNKFAREYVNTCSGDTIGNLGGIGAAVTMDVVDTWDSPTRPAAHAFTLAATSAIPGSVNTATHPVSGTVTLSE